MPVRAAWNGPNPSHSARPHAPSHRRSDSGNYYEDVDPRFAIEEAPLPSPVPAALTPGVGMHQPNRFPSPNHLHPSGNNASNSNPDLLGPSTSSSEQRTLSRAGDSYENIPEGARSPADSDASHFTSISQRGINPNWRPMGGPGGPGMGYNGGGAPASRPQGPRRDDVILGANPDFALPGMSRPMRGGGGPGGRGGMMRGTPSPMGRPGGLPQGGMSGQGRYPTEF